MPIFTNILKNVKDFFKPAPVEDFCKTHPAIPLVWNKEGVLLDTRAGNGEYSFEHFTGHISLYKRECEVENASFTFHAGMMKLLAGSGRPAGPFGHCAVSCNWLNWDSGTLLAGHLKCSNWESGTVAGGLLECNVFESGIVNAGNVCCSYWASGTVNGGELNCRKWQCGTFNCGTLQGLEPDEKPSWNDGIFNGGTFKIGSDPHSSRYNVWRNFESMFKPPVTQGLVRYLQILDCHASAENMFTLTPKDAEEIWKMKRRKAETEA